MTHAIDGKTKRRDIDVIVYILIIYDSLDPRSINNQRTLCPDGANRDPLRGHLTVGRETGVLDTERIILSQPKFQIYIIILWH
jgi:hypothetical protein